MFRKRIGIALSATALCFAGVTAQAAFVDSFEVDMVNVDIESGMNTSTSGPLDAAQVIGGVRSVMTTLEITDPLGTGVSTEINLNNSGLAALSSNFGTVGTWMFTWDGGGAGLGADLSADTFFQADFIDSDRIADVTIEVVDGSTASAQVAKQTVAAASDSVVFDFSEFAGIDFSDIFSIKLTINGRAGGDYGLTQVVTGSGGTVIPAPGAFAGGVVLMGVMGMIGRRRRA